MKRIFKKNQIIITALAIMIAVAGYLNYSGTLLQEKADTVSSADNTVLVTDEEIYEDTYTDDYSDIVSMDADITDGTDFAGADAPGTDVGEAVLASSTVSDNVLAEAKLNREQVRAKSKETLLEVINNAEIADDQKQNAIAAMTNMAQNAEMEAAAELLLEAKGFAGCVVSITDGSADVVVNKTDLGDAQRAQIEDIVKRKTEIPGENIVIMSKSTGTADTADVTEQTDAADMADTAAVTE